MGCDHLGDLVRIDARLAVEVGGGGQVLRLAVVPREHLVRNPLHEGLQEPVLPAAPAIVGPTRA
jgi:hypothetical protein